MGRKNKVQEAIDKIKAEIEAQERVLMALESIQKAQGTTGKRTRKSKADVAPAQDIR